MLLYRNKVKLYLIISSLFLSFLYANDSFITNMEYAKMLYKNPRGIGCDKCHGLKGKGKTIAKYKDKGQIKYLKAPDITNVDEELFLKTFFKRHKIMPKYFLTYQEINTLYMYIKNINKKTKKRGKK